MRRLNPLAPMVLAAALLAPAAQAACEYPADVKIPDGTSATQEEITAASASVKKYLADMEAYTACLDAEAAAVPVEQQTPEIKAMHVKRYNAAVDAMEATANAFNEQLRTFKAANK
jgi:polyisoprenoid-binding protein YceI